MYLAAREHCSTNWNRPMTCAHPVSRLVRVAWLAWLTIATGSCSLVFVHGPPKASDRITPFTCTERNTLPALDLVAAGLTGALAFIAATQWSKPDSYYYYASDEVAYGSVAGSALYGLSAFVGFRKTKDCRQATQQLRSQGLQ